MSNKEKALQMLKDAIKLIDDSQNLLCASNFDIKEQVSIDNAHEELSGVVDTLTLNIKKTFNAH